MRRLESAQNPEIKSVAALKERRGRSQQNLFLIEGAREIVRAQAGGVVLERLYLCPDLLSDEGRALLGGGVLAALEPIEVSAAAFGKLSMRENPDGLAAVAQALERDLNTLVLPPDPLLLVLEGLEKPGNVGALLRTADGVGVDAVLVVGSTDLENPNTIRASQGSVFTVPVRAAPLEEVLAFLHVRAIPLLAATPHAEQRYWQADLSGGVAVALGTEHAGLSRGLLEAAALRVSIPMRGHADSLNVGIAGALLLYEALRQRSSAAG